MGWKNKHGGLLIFAHIILKTYSTTRFFRPQFIRQHGSNDIAFLVPLYIHNAFYHGLSDNTSQPAFFRLSLAMSDKLCCTVFYFFCTNFPKANSPMIHRQHSQRLLGDHIQHDTHMIAWNISKAIYSDHSFREIKQSIVFLQLLFHKFII